MARVIGWYSPGPNGLLPISELGSVLQQLDTPFGVAESDGRLVIGVGGSALLGGAAPPRGALPLRAWAPPLTPEMLGDPAFCSAFGLRLAYVAGAMANGIASVPLVSAIARGGGLGFFGAAGLPTERIAAAIDALQAEIPGLPFGVNLIHSPAEPWQERQTVDLLLQRGVRAVELSAYLALTPPVVLLRAKSLEQRGDAIAARVRLVAKVSRPEVAERFLRPPPKEMLAALVQKGEITEEEAARARQMPVVDHLTAEADSGGHTDNRPLVVLLPLLMALADKVSAAQGYRERVTVGAAGGLGSPAAVAAALSMGAAYVVTGTVNQACLEADTSPMAKAMLAEAGMADIDMAPASDMFEAGVKLQVLKRGTLFPRRAEKLYEIYRAYPSLEALPEAVRADLEGSILHERIDEIWRQCEGFFAKRDPAQLERASREPKHRMALVFRWYLGRSSRWAIAGDEGRRTDAQIWCGPAIGAFNDWTAGSFLASPGARDAVTVAVNLMAGAAVLLRAQSLRSQGLRIHIDPYGMRPRPLVADTDRGDPNVRS